MPGIYIHIPFCRKRCNYCDFYFITNLKAAGRFLAGLKTEITISSEQEKDESFDSVFFGGGTPSVLPASEIDSILNHLHKNFALSADSEITLEANPEDFSAVKFRDYAEAGINRISFGVQSFLDSELKFLTRQHTAEDAMNAVRNASVYFGNINTDIIYSLPSQTIKDIDFSLSAAAGLNVSHISAYTLTFEERTPLYKSLQKNLVKKNPESLEGEFYGFVSEKLISSGYGHYEVSNFARKGFECRHNLKYWKYENYAGFGPSAHSMKNGIRRNNFRNIQDYYSSLEKGILPVEEKIILTPKQKKSEYIMLALRSSGIYYNDYSKTFPEDFREEFGKPFEVLLKENFAESNEEGFFLTEKGYAVADEIISKYFWT